MADKRLRVIFFLLIAYLVKDSLSLLLGRAGKADFLVYNISLLVETFALFYFFSQVLLPANTKKVLSVLALLCLTVWGFSLWQYDTSAYFNSYEVIENISLLALIIYYYYENLVTTNTDIIYTERAFWVTTAYLFYISGTFFLLLYIPQLSKEEGKSYYLLNYVFVIIRNLLLCIAFFIKTGNNKDRSRLVVNIKGRVN